MYCFVLPLVLLLSSGLKLATSTSECCKTGYDTYERCTFYCCHHRYSYSYSYNECCSTYSRKATFTYADESECSNWFNNNTALGAVLASLGCIAFIAGIVSCCVCCIKGCTASNRRTGAILVHPGQQGPGVLMVNSTTQQQQQHPYPYGVPAQPGQAAYPPEHPGPSNYGPPGAGHPPPYTAGNEKAGGPLP